MGGYASAICPAKSREEFFEKAFEALRDRQLSPDDQFDEIEDISLRYRDGLLSDEWMEFCKLAVETGNVAFNCFDLYAANEEN